MNATMPVAVVTPQGEKPQNGISGLKHLQHDILSGIVVSLVSLPLSSGIAIASGAPPIYGLISAVIAGLIFPFIGGAYVTISGPAAGLAPALFAIMVAMGGAGDAEHTGAGYPMLLAIIFMVGCVQIILAVAKLARFAAIIPVSVVEGMLASIGMLIIVKQLPMFFGFTGKVEAHEFYEFLRDAPHYATNMNGAVFTVAISSLVLLFVLDSFKKVKALRVVPPQLIAVLFGAMLGQLLNVGGQGNFLISLPKDPFHGIHAPGFAELLSRPELWYAAALGVLTLTMIDGVESLATAMAIDRIDPFRRKSEPNRLLLAMGISNICSSLVGGLTIIPGGVKSKVNIASGGRTLWANFTNAMCLVIYLVVAYQWINMIPKGVLGAVLIFTGWKMCEPLVWKHMAKIGWEQLGIFSFTVAFTLLTDLLWGIVAGVIAKLILNVVLYRRAVRSGSDLNACPSIVGCVTEFFKSPVGRTEQVGATCHVYLNRPVVCFNSMWLTDALLKIDSSVKSIVVHLDRSVALIDHTACENLMHSMNEALHSDQSFEIAGLERMKMLSKHQSCARVLSPVVAAAV